MKLDFAELQKRRSLIRGCKRQEDQYEISSRASSQDGESSEDEEGEGESQGDSSSGKNSFESWKSDQGKKKRKKPIPSWCREWTQTVQQQQRVDPDTVFGMRIAMPHMSAIFGSLEGVAPKRRKRGSSLNWDDDLLTRSEVKLYKTAMGHTEKFEPTTKRNRPAGVPTGLPRQSGRRAEDTTRGLHQPALSQRSDVASKGAGGTSSRKNQNIVGNGVGRGGWANH